MASAADVAGRRPACSLLLSEWLDRPMTPVLSTRVRALGPPRGPMADAGGGPATLRDCAGPPAPRPPPARGRSQVALGGGGAVGVLGRPAAPAPGGGGGVPEEGAVPPVRAA